VKPTSSNLYRRTPRADPRVQKIMQGYHEFVERGKREIYEIE